MLAAAARFGRIDLAIKICFLFHRMQNGKVYHQAASALQVDPKRLRHRMVREQLQARGISNPAVLAAMASVPRHLFVQEALRAQAYEDAPLPIGYGQTISQPYIVALMSELLEVERGMRVLEIGTGSGYQAAVLATMGWHGSLPWNVCGNSIRAPGPSCGN